MMESADSVSFILTVYGGAGSQPASATVAVNTEFASLPHPDVSRPTLDQRNVANSSVRDDIR